MWPDVTNRTKNRIYKVRYCAIDINSGVISATETVLNGFMHCDRITQIITNMHVTVTTKRNDFEERDRYNKLNKDSML